MRNLIYYPSFEVPNENWLKFSLLYLDELSPIIPPEGDKNISKTYEYVKDETDLIKIHRPSPKEGHEATLDTIEILEKILKYPVAYEEFFGERNLLEKWKNKDQQNSTLFEQKYSHYWKEFCIENNLAHNSKYGMKLPNDILMIYMTILAQCIADARGISPITDNPLLDKFSILSRKEDKDEQCIMNTAQTQIELTLPKNLNELSFKDIITHRNRDGFKEKQKAFHVELNNFFTQVESNEEDLSTYLGTSWNDFSDDIVILGSGITTFSIGVWLMLGADGDQSQQALEKLAGATATAAGAIVTIRNTWENTKSKRLARRYLSNISTLV